MKRIHFFVLAIALFSCQSKDASLEQFHWMEGEWIKDSEKTTVTKETWKITSKNEMTGAGLTSENGDTIFFETLKIISQKSNIYYLADVGEGIVPFKLTESLENGWVFENPEHDFPKRIVYSREGDLMIAYTEAGDVSIPFVFKKSK